MSSGALPTPEPMILPETEPFWNAAADGRLLLPYCARCRQWVWYPRALCSVCSSTDVQWREHSGRGTIYSYSDVRRNFGAFADCVPYIVAYVDLEDGPRVLTNIIDADMQALAIGQPVEPVWHTTESGKALLRFRVRH